MILSAAKAFLSTYRIYIWIAVAVIAISAVAYAWHAHNASQQALGASKVIAAYQEGYDKGAKDAADKELADRSMWAKQSSDYEAQLYALRHPAQPVTTPIVLCHQSRPNSSAMPKSPAITSGPVTTDSAGLAKPHETDIGQDLIAFATDVQAMAIQCKAIQEGYLKLSGQAF